MNHTENRKLRGIKRLTLIITFGLLMITSSAFAQHIDLQNVTILDLQNLVKDGKLSYKELTQMYLNRIELFDFNTIKLNSVRILNPQALADAERCDLVFAADPAVAKGMFGIPVLVKDNINVTGMPTTAGSVALAGNYAPYNATLITRLKASGAVILGKTNLTEFANYIAIGMANGFSSLGGQVLNPYRPVRLMGDTVTMYPSGSSAGSGVAAAAALSTVTVGTETSGSILSPCFTNSIAGIKPTVGLISRYGVIPISSSQDIAGPMGRNVTDIAILLNALAGYDPKDETTGSIEKAGVTGMDYTRSLKLGGLKGKRIGLVGIPDKNNFAFAPFQKALQALKDAGVEIVTRPNGAALTYYNPDNPDVNPPYPASIVLDYDFAKDLPAYLATLDEQYPIKTLQNIVDFNNAYMKTDSAAFPFGQAIMIRCAGLDLEAQKERYLEDRAKDILYSRVNGIDYLLKQYNLDCIVSTSHTGSTTGIAAKAGYPTVSIPLANPGGTAYPVNMHFTGTAFSEAQLIEFAYTVEQATHFRIPPDLTEKSSLGAIRLDMKMKTFQSGNFTFKAPEAYLQERKDIPSFWIGTVDGVAEFLYRNVKKGQIEIIGYSAGGRPIRAVVYGNARQGKGTTTFSGSLGFRDVKAYRGRDHEKTVYFGIAGVHGFELEGIVGMVNLISVIETGKDLRGKAWPEIAGQIAKIDRLVLIPVANPDGRARLPLRMAVHRGADFTVHEYLNTGGNPDGTIIGWPQIKEFIPLDFGKPGFPGGYPNDAGVNIMHDDFFGKIQPETQALFDLAARERPDLVMNMHTGAVYMNMHRPFCEPVLSAVFDTLYTYVHKRLTIEKLQGAKTVASINPQRAERGVYNLDTALNLHCGALSVVVESPSHNFDGKTSNGALALHTPDMLLDAQLFCHQEAMRFLAETGGRSKWKF